MTVPAGRTVTFTNTATVAAPGGVTDPTPGNNSATDTDTQASSADLSVTKTDGSSTYMPGNNVVYTVVVSNAGPSSVTGATVADALPTGITTSNWTAVAAGGATGFTASGSGAISDTVTMPAGSSITYTVTMSVPAGRTGTLTNTATVAAPGGVTDPTPGNNSNGSACTNRPIRQDYLDQFVQSEIIRLLEDPGLIQTEINRCREA